MIGQTISQYHILEKLGEGGMGVVYKAQDTKLNRAVALKFLPPHMAASEQDKARFIQEAQSAAALNHPNICSIIDIQEHAGTMFIVMEFVDGQTLQERKSSLTQKQAIDIAIQVAEGLAAAHEKGIVHRDIKPENVMVRKDGIAQIMDFGLAKLAGVSRLTKPGSTVGTLGYMSPEQVQGQETDHRSDIFAFGVLLYEMLTGRSPFNGAHESAILYEIVNVDVPPPSTLKPELDPELDRIVMECLEKDPNERMQSIKQAAIDLNRFKRTSSRTRMSRSFPTRPVGSTSEASPFGRSVPFGRREMIAWGLSILCFTALIAFLWFRASWNTAAAPTINANILPPEGWRYFNEYDGGHIALSPDGTMLAFVATDSSMKASLWVQSIQTGVTQQLNGTEGATFPFWSPDDRMIGFFADGALKKIPAAGGPTTTLCPAPQGRGGAWNSDGVILFSPSLDQTGLYRVSANGGEPKQVTRVDSSRNETNHRWPYFLPDGKHFIYTTQASNKNTRDYFGAMYICSLDSSINARLTDVTSNVAYANGYLLYVKQAVIVAQRFDLSSLTLTGDAMPVSPTIEYSNDKSRGIFTCASNGLLVYQTGQAVNRQRKVILVDRNGRRKEPTTPVLATLNAAFSPDGTRIVYDLFDSQSRTNDIWIHDIPRGINTKLTFEKSDDIYPIWTADGSQVVFSSDQGVTQSSPYIKNVNGTEAEKLLCRVNDSGYPNDCSADGRYLLFQTFNPETGSDLVYFDMQGEKTPHPFINERFDEGTAAFSPDGRWVSYESNEAGRVEAFVRPFPTGSGKWQISTEGGRFTHWRKDGKELYYRSIDGTVFSVAVNGTGTTFSIGPSTPLFRVPRSEDPQLYDVSADGRMFVIGVIAQGQKSAHLKLVTNWYPENQK